MQVFSFLLRFIPAFLSLLGGMMFLYDRTKLDPAFLPLVTLSSFSVILFLAGLTEILLPVTYVLFGAGLCAFVYCVVQGVRKKFSFRFLLSPGMLFFFGAALFFIPVLWNAHYYHYDNFSHWGTVLSEMLCFDAFPSYRTVVNFRDYAPGSASFLYAFCRMVGTEEFVALIGQSLLNTAALSALFFRVKRVRSVRFAATVLLAAGLLALMQYDDGSLHIYNLLVDATMGYTAAGALFMQERFRDDPIRGAGFLVPVLTFLGLLKLNGILFSITVSFLLFVRLIRRGKWILWRELFLFTGLTLTPFAVRFFWRLYHTAAYPKANGVVTEPFLLFTERSEGFFSTVLSRFPQKLIDFSQVYVPLVLLLTAAVVILWIAVRRRGGDTSVLKLRFLTGGVLLILYLLALLFLYCFLMAEGEAIYLAAFDRYVITPVIVFTALVCEGVFETVERLQSGNATVRAVPLLLGAVLLFCVRASLPQLVKRIPFAETERGKVYDCLYEASQSLPRGARVILYNGATGRRDLYYNLMLYQLKSRSCFVLDSSVPETQFFDELGAFYGSDYLIVGAEDLVLPESLKAAGYTAEWQPGCRLYQIISERGEISVFPYVPNEK